MDFTVSDGIKEKAATVSELADKAKTLADKGLDAAENFVCVQILNIYTMIYLTAGQVLAAPYMAIKIAKVAIKKLDKAVIAGAKDSFYAAATSLMNAQDTEVLYYDGESGTCSHEHQKSKIQKDPSYAQQALHAMEAAKNCPLLDSFTSTAGFNSAFSLLKLYNAMSNTSLDEAGALLAEAVADSATNIVDNLAKSLEDTAFGALKKARNMYKAALKQSGIEEIFKLLGIGQSCLMDLCNDDSVLEDLNNMPLAPYLAKAGGFVAENLQKIDKSYFTFTFDFDKSTGADKLSKDEKLNTTIYKLKYSAGGMPNIAMEETDTVWDIYTTGFENLTTAIEGAVVVVVDVFAQQTSGGIAAATPDIQDLGTYAVCTISGIQDYLDEHNMPRRQYTLSLWSGDLPDFFNVYVKDRQATFITADNLSEGDNAAYYNNIGSGVGHGYSWLLFYEG